MLRLLANRLANVAHCIHSAKWTHSEGPGIINVGPATNVIREVRAAFDNMWFVFVHICRDVRLLIANLCSCCISLAKCNVCVIWLFFVLTVFIC